MQRLDVADVRFEIAPANTEQLRGERDAEVLARFCLRLKSEHSLVNSHMFYAGAGDHPLRIEQVGKGGHVSHQPDKCITSGLAGKA